MTGPTVGELMSDRHPNTQYDDEDEEDDEEEDDFVPRRRRLTSSDEEEAPMSKRIRYSPSAPNGHARPSPPPPRAASPSSSQSHPAQPLAPSAPALPPPATKPLEHSILNVEPVDEFIREVGDFIHRHVVNHAEHVEVEAKIGVLKDSVSGQRIRIPVGVETTLSSELSAIRFESNMSVTQHRHYNTLLNNLGAEPSQSEAPRTPLKYQHTHLVDSLYTPPDGSRDKIRVTVDEATGKVVQCIRKVRLGDLNIYSPKRSADWRISVNLEIPTTEPTGTPVHTRKKDRLTYTHQYCNIDLTQVKQSASPHSAPTVLHELELELHPSAMPVLLHSASRRNSPDPSLSQEQRDEFDDIIRIFVNNARILVRNAGSGWQGS